MPNPSEQPLGFPSKGVDRTTEYELQPEGTTPLAVNVSGSDADTGRERGGSREGIEKWAPLQPAGVRSEIQLLDVIVTVHTDAYLGSIVNDDGTTGEPPGTTGPGIPDPTPPLIPPGAPPGGDPRNPGRDIPPGGTGVPPRRNKPPVSPPPPPPPAGAWVYVQEANDNTGSGSSGTSPVVVSYPDATLIDQLLVVIATYWIHGTSPNMTIDIEDSLGNDWTALDLEEVAGQDQATDPAKLGVRIYYAVNEAGGANDVTVTFNGTEDYEGSVLIAEFKGLQNASPQETQGSDSDNLGDTPDMGTHQVGPGAVLQNGPTRLVVGAVAIVAANYFLNLTEESAETYVSLDQFQGGVTAHRGLWCHNEDTPTGTFIPDLVGEFDYTDAPSVGDLMWVSVAATFRFGGV